MQAKDQQLIIDRLGDRFEPEMLQQLIAQGELHHFKKDDIVIDLGMPIRAMPLMVQGALKVMREDEEYRELLLYYLETGDTCTMSMTCCMEQKKSTVRAIAEEDSVIAFIPALLVSGWIAEFPKWRNYIFSSFQLRLEELMGAVDNLAFLKMDERLLRYLEKLKEIQGSNSIQTTHRKISEDLNTSRVVVSRVLKDLEKQGRLRIHRSSIELH